MEKKIIQTDQAPAAVGTYSQGVAVGGTYYFSGQIGLHPQSAELSSDFSSELDQILKNIDALLTSAQLSRSDIVKTSIFLTDLAHFQQVNDAYERYFTPPYPARSCVQVSALPKGANVEIEVIAVKAK